MRFLQSLLLALIVSIHAQADEVKTLAAKLTNPESCVVGADGRLYVTVIGEFDKDGDGSVVRIDGEKIETVIPNLDDPKGIAHYQGNLFIADKKKVLKYDAKGKLSVFAAPDAFPKPPLFLNDVLVDPESGTVFVSDSGSLDGKNGAIYRITPKGQVTLLADSSLPFLRTPNGLALDGQNHLLILDFHTGELNRLRLADKQVEKLADGFGGGDGLAWDHFGRLFVSDWKDGRLFVIPRPGEKPILLPHKFQAAADICLGADGKSLIVPDMKAGTVVSVPIRIPGAAVDQSPLGFKTVPAFPNLKWTGWQGETDSGKVNALRPILLTHAGDGTKRIFIATEHGVIHTLTKGASATSIFLDIQDRVIYTDKQNEEGFLGLAFHPKFQETGEFFVFYTTSKEKLTNVVSRFRVRKDDPTKGDPNSEEVLMRFSKPFWNHDGGTIAFGPDGYLYITHGDGGKANDPFDNGQNLQTYLGKILRIDVNTKTNGKPYGIPKDNPFVGRTDALPEIWAYGFRNVWRMHFDRQTGDLWAADVGQNLYEEINLVRKGGNYGWNRREALHPFGPKGVGGSADFVEPIWEYHHDIGKSITGGFVYRGKEFPELNGYYFYADYVSNRFWALKYDAAVGRVVANRPVTNLATAIMSFGEDEDGELYVLHATPSGQGVWRLAKE